MDEHQALKKHLERLGRETAYPPTPDIARSVAVRLGERAGWRMRRSTAWSLAVLVLVLAVLFAVPGVRAEILRFLQIGVVQILISPPTPAATVPATATATAAATGAPSGAASAAQPSASPQGLPSATPATITSLLPLGEEISLEAAEQAAGFPLRLPGYPPDLGDPDRVYYQAKGPVVVLVWLEAGQDEQVRMSLHAIGPDSIVLRKNQPAIVQETSVNGGYAVWTEGPYLLEIDGGDYRHFRLVDGHTLIWDEEGITYRLESALPLDDAVRIAESLQ